MKTRFMLILFCLLAAGCIQASHLASEDMTPEMPTPQITMEALPNPASAFCEQQGNILEIRTAADGSQTGVCVFPDGSECDEWAFFRGECMPDESSAYDDSGWKIYTNDTLGYSFHYPADAQVTTNDDPLKSLYISGPEMAGESWSIAHPSDRPEFRPPDGVDLLQWLTDHYLVGENRLPNVQIGGITAIHFRHERSPQSPADDKFFFASNGQLYLVTIGHTNEVEDWELNNRFLQNIQFTEPAAKPLNPALIPTALPVDPTTYADWMTYTHPTYGFSIRLPDVWAVEEVNAADPLLSGHALNLHSLLNPQAANIRITFRQAGEDIPLWPTGVGQGEFIPQGTLAIAGSPAQRLLLVCPNGDVTAIWYQGESSQPAILRRDMELGIIFSTYGHCEPGYSLGGKAQLEGETIISSLQLP